MRKRRAKTFRTRGQGGAFAGWAKQPESQIWVTASKKRKERFGIISRAVSGAKIRGNEGAMLHLYIDGLIEGGKIPGKEGVKKRFKGKIPAKKIDAFFDSLPVSIWAMRG